MLEKVLRLAKKNDDAFRSNRGRGFNVEATTAEQSAAAIRALVEVVEAAQAKGSSLGLGKSAPLHEKYNEAMRKLKALNDGLEV